MPNYSYLICFSVDPVQFGFVCRNLPDYKQFKGLNALNQYFDMVAPNTNAKSIPDVWDGYYRITLVQFYSETSPEKMREQFESFPLTSSNVPLLKQPFQVRRIGETPDSFWLPSDSADEPISLFVTRPIGFPLNLVLEKIKGHINQREWIKIPEHLLHMNIKFYSNTANKNWTWQKIKQHGIPEKVRKHTIQFHHTTLEIIPSRETCTKTYDQKSGNPWWIGVTELERKCSGCQYPVQNQWKGVCSSCHQYERIKPIWSIPCSQDTASVTRNLDTLC